MRIHLCTRDGSGGVGAVALGCVSVLVSFELAMFRNLLTQASSNLTGL
jgi:hypothetical protein